MGFFRRRSSEHFEMPRRMFETRSEAWRDAGLSLEVDRRDARKARLQVLILLGLGAGVLVAFSHRQQILPGEGTLFRAATVLCLVVIGWLLAQALGRGLAPGLFRRMDPGTAGTVGFVIRLLTIIVVTIVALRIAGLNAGALAVGGAATAVVLGLAAQQTLGNVFAGIVLQTTRPYRVGERVRLTAGPLAGSVEGTVSSLGLFYATLINGADRMMVPNSIVLQCAVIPLREPERVDVRARFDADVSPARVQEELSRGVSVPTRYPPQITLEEIDRDQVVLRIAATPDKPSDGARLAEEIVAATRREGQRGGDSGNGNGSRVETAV
jgi:small conductance mechanosensitive channel